VEALSGGRREGTEAPECRAAVEPSVHPGVPAKGMGTDAGDSRAGLGQSARGQTSGQVDPGADAGLGQAECGTAARSPLAAGSPLRAERRAIFVGLQP